MTKAKYIGGSSLFLKHYNDIDYFYYYASDKSMKKALVENQDHEHDIHFINMKKEPHVFLGCYAYPFMQHVEGEEIEAFKTFSIFDHKKEYVEKLKWYASVLPDSHKKWYHILIACYMFQNGKMELSADQIEQVQQVHDNGISKELKDYCFKQLDLIQ